MNSLANVTNKPPMASDERFNNASNKSLAKNDNSPGWYTATYMSEDTAKKDPRYGGGRFKRWEFILCHLLVIWLTITIIMIPIFYYVLFPMGAQWVVDHIEDLPIPSPELKYFSSKSFFADGLSYNISIEIPIKIPIPLKVGAGPMNARVLQNDMFLLTETPIPRMTIAINEGIRIAFEGQVVISPEAQANLRQFLAEFSSPAGISNLFIMLRFDVPMYVFDWKIYSGIPLHRKIPIGRFQASLQTFTDLATRFQNSKFSRFKLFTPLPPDDLFRAYPNNDTYNVTSNLAVVLNSLNLGANDQGIQTTTAVSFVNPFPFVAEQIPFFKFYLTIQNVKIVEVTVENIGIGLGLQNQLTTKVSLDFTHTSIDATSVRNAISLATTSFSENSSLVIGVAGPFSIANGPFLAAATDSLYLNLNVAKIVPKIKSLIQNEKVQSLLTAANVKTVLGNSTVRIDVMSENILTTTGLVLPVFFPIPRVIDIPYGITFAIYAANEKAIQIHVSPIKIIRTDTAIIVNNSLSIIPSKNDMAAMEFAKALNPVLSVNSMKSQVGIRDFAMFQYRADQPVIQNYKWCETLSAGQNVNFPIPAINKTKLIQMVLDFMGKGPSANSYASFVKSSLPFVIRALDIAQLSDKPGFGANGIVDVFYPEGFPAAFIDIGYFTVTSTVENIKFMDILLPVGLKFFPQQPGTIINGQAVFNRDPNLSRAAQAFMDALTLSTALPSYVGITGLAFGLSPQNHFQVFSKLNIEIESSVFTSVFDYLKQNSGSLLKMLPPGLIKVTKAGFTLTSSTQASSIVECVINNPINVRLTTGMISSDVALNNGFLLRTIIHPFVVNPGQSAIQLGVDMILSDGSYGVNMTVGHLFDALMNDNVPLQVMGSLNGLVMTPAQRLTDDAIINQLQPVQLRAMLDPMVYSLRTKMKTMSYSQFDMSKSPIDISSLLPNNEIFSNIHPRLSYVMMTVEPQGKLNSGADIQYMNPLPLFTKIPYISSVLKLNGHSALETIITGVQLDLAQGSMSPRITLKSNSDGEIPTLLNDLVTGFMNGQLKTYVGISNMVFGDGHNNHNYLLSAINADVTTLLLKVQSQGPIIRQKIMFYLNALPYYMSAKQFMSQDKPHTQADIPITINTPTGDLMHINGPYNFNASINSFGVKAHPNGIFTMAMKGSVEIPFKVDINIPFLQTSAIMDDNVFGTLGISGLKLTGNGPTPLDMAIQMAFNDIDPVATSVANLVDGISSRAPLIGTLGGGYLILGAGPNDFISTFSKVVIKLPTSIIGNPIKQLLANTEATQNLPQNVRVNIDMNQLWKIMDPSEAALGLKAREGHSMDATIKINFNNPFRVSIDGLGFMGANVHIDSVPFLKSSLVGFGIAEGRNSLSTASNIAFPSSDAIKEKMVLYVQAMLQTATTKLISNVDIDGLFFGNSPSDYVKLFRKVKLSLPASLLINHDVVTSVSQYLSTLKMPFDMNMVNSVMRSIKLGQARIAFSPSKQIDSTIDLSSVFPFKKPVTFDLSMPYASAGSLVDSVRGIDAVVNGFSLTGYDRHRISVSTSLIVHDTDDLATKIGAITDALNSKKPLPGSIGGGYVRFGLSSADHIDTFSNVAVSFQLEKLVKMLLNRTSSIKKSSIDLTPMTAALKQFGISISAVKLEGRPNRSLNTGAVVTLGNPFPISLTGLSYYSMYGGMEGIPIFYAAGNGLSISQGTSDASLNLMIQFPSSPVIQVMIAKFTNDIIQGYSTRTLGNTPQQLLVGGLMFGTSQETAFKFLSKVNIAIPSKWILSQSMAEKLVSTIKSRVVTPQYRDTLRRVLETVNLENAGVAFRDSSIDSKVALSLSLPFSHPVQVDVSLPYTNMGSMIDGLSAFGLKVNGLTISGREKTGVKLASAIYVYDTDELANKIGSITRAISSNQVIPGVATGGFLHFGVSSTDYIDSFSKTAISVYIEHLVRPLINKMYQQSPPNQNGQQQQPPKPLIIDMAKIKTLPEKYGFYLSDVSMVTMPNKMVQTTARLGVKQVLPIEISGLGYFAVYGGLNNDPAMLIQGNGMTLLPNSGPFDSVFYISFPSSPALKTTIAGLMRKIYTVMATNQMVPFEERLLGGGLIFGSSKEKAMKFLSKAVISIPTQQLMSKVLIKNVQPANVPPAAQPKPAIPWNDILSKIELRKVVVDMGKYPNSMTNDAEIHLPNILSYLLPGNGYFTKLVSSLNAHVHFGYMDTTITMNDQALVSAQAIGGLTITKAGTDVNIKVGHAYTLYDGPKVQTDIMQLVQILSSPVGQGLPSNYFLSLGGYGVLFGHSQTDFVDTLSSINERIYLQQHLPKAKATISTKIESLWKPRNNGTTASAASAGDSGIASRLRKMGVQIYQIDFDIIEKNTMVIDVGLVLPKIPDTIILKMPWGQMTAFIDGSHLMTGIASNVQLYNRTFTTRIYSQYSDNTAGVQQFMNIFTVLVSKRYAIPAQGPVISIGQVMFGSSQQTLKRTFSKVTLGMPVNYQKLVPALQQMYKSSGDTAKRLMESVSGEMAFGRQGIEGQILFPALPFPVNVKVTQILAKGGYQLNGTGQMYSVGDMMLHSINIRPNQMSSVGVLIFIDTSEKTGIIRPILELLPYLITWQDFSRNVSGGDLSMVGSNGVQFTAFRNTYLKPPPMVLFSPIVLSFVYTNPLARKEQSITLPVSMKLYLPAVVPIKITLGILRLDILDSKKQPIVILGSLDTFVVQPSTAKSPVNGLTPAAGELGIQLPRSTINNGSLFGYIEDLFKGDFKLRVSVIQNGYDLEWIHDLVKNMQGVQDMAMPKVARFIASVLAHINVEMFGAEVPFRRLKGYDAVVQMADEFLANAPKGKFEISHYLL